VSQGLCCSDKRRVIVVGALAAMTITATTLLGDSPCSSGELRGPRKFAVLISVTSSARVTLVDGRSRRNGWRGRKEVAEIPGCGRGSDAPETMIEGGSVEGAPNTVFVFDAVRGQRMRLLVDAVVSEKVRVLLQVSGVGEKAGCGADEFAQVTKGRRYVWNLGWGALADSCWASVRRCEAQHSGTDS